VFSALMEDQPQHLQHISVIVYHQYLCHPATSTVLEHR
jgi:hypothetical protein